jgi:formylglycine-generating enzyme required for sulfatase activity
VKLERLDSASPGVAAVRRVFRLPGDVPMAFCRIPTGEFLMGSRGENPREEPMRRMTLSNPFWMGETPVTQAQFGAWTQSEGVGHKNHFEGRADHPAENMTWYEANRFCQWLNLEWAQGADNELLDGCTLFCLPTEVEWEYACRAGTETVYNTGDDEEALHEAAWFGEDWQKGSTYAVRGKVANRWGLCDMHGNVWEWCHEVFDSRAFRLVEGFGPDSAAEVRWLDWRTGRELFFNSEGSSDPDRTSQTAPCDMRALGVV